MRHRRSSRAFAFLSILSLALAAAPAAAAEELRGAAILEHPCGNTAVRHMGLVHAGKMAEAVRLGTPAMQKKWQDLPAEDRAMMSELMQAMSQSEEEFGAAIREHGVLTLAGKAATLVVEIKRQDENGDSTETMRQQFALDGASCLIDRGDGME